MHGWKHNKLLLASQRYDKVFGWLAVIGLLLELLIHGYPATAQSVLREGVWVRIGVTESGVYRLDQTTLARLNPAFATANPRLLRLYGDGGAPLPQANKLPRPTDLTENAVQITGEVDGRFDAGDAILFFGQSPRVIRYDSIAQRFTHRINPYADTTFYFLTIDSTSGKRLKDRTVGAPTETVVRTTFDDYQFHEQDLLKIPALRTGREWLGEYLTIDTTKTIAFSVPGLVTNSPVRLAASVVAGALVPTQFRFRVNNQAAGNIAIPSISGYEYDYQGIARMDTFLVKPTTAETSLQVSMTFQKNGQLSAQGYLNFVGIQTQRELRQYDQPTWVRRLPAGAYSVRQATNALRVWDVTNPLIPVNQAYTLAATAEARWSASHLGDYFLFTDNQVRTPSSLAVIANQNLRGQAAPNLLIITPAAWRDQAERLAAFRRSHDGLTALVVTTQQVYNEFASGQSDPTAIRDAVRYFYQKLSGQLRYVLLFGDATFDYRNIAQLVNPAQLANTVPVYESRESLHPVLSYSSDDYYGFMDEDEGNWEENTAGDHRMDVGVGRLPVKSLDEAHTVVDKLIRYSSDFSVMGDWQTRIMLVADDGDYNIHQQDVNQLANGIEMVSPAYRSERVYIDAYPQEATSNGQKAPIVNQLINRAVADGRLIINYSGHGGVSGLADEQIVTLQDILSWNNRRLPLFVTATCQFGRYDDPSANSGAEIALLSRLGGAIGLLTTTRPVYANTNLLINKAFYNAVFTPVNGQLPRLGDVMQATKNNSLSGPLNRNFALLGDPSMRLAYPQANVVLTKVNNQAVTANRLDTLKALQAVELVGEIQQNQQRLANFSGKIQVTLYDKATVQTTLGTESAKMNYQAYTSTLFTGQVPVQNGQFTVRFVMPKDIDYAVGRAKLYAYAIRADSLLEAIGSYDSLRVGGSITTDSLDTQPPVVQLSVEGGVVSGEVVRVAGPAITLRINLRDNQGINVARSGLGHELTAQLGGQTPVILNDLYVSTGNDGRQGEALYTFQDVAPGQYTVRVKAWDINNNSTEGALTLIVSEKPELSLRTTKVTPNPVTSQAIITAEHNRTGEPLDWTLRIFDLNGRLFNQQTGQCSDCPAELEIGTWNGQSEAGQAAPNGVYLFRIQVRSAADGSMADSSGRLMLLK
ncbi:type IX secretion system sortase PorU [Spirosoma taeanense]|uniref:Type IX secretion system sortase PorU n=1 Tax=Spirosoma taeanense TaxID=2735870 RepID=A0A6M5XZ50_9BACT|nr:type IX secretion system sortase PorU [Spirosoma taeanense]QJW87887.1 type IX secretion system sortase PorU [Spirosoma taeanense]